MTNADRSQFGHDTTTDEVLDGIDLTGKIALITGASGGIGEETARALASKGANVIITARTAAKGQPVADKINESVGRDAVSVETLELGSQASVKALAERVLASTPKLDLMINNAGVMGCPFSKTEDGFEMQFGSNHLGHFVLTCLLAPALIAAAPARIVCLSSRAHQMSPVIFDDVNFENRDYNKWASYGQAKTANALFAVGLNKRLSPKGVEAFSVHPGVIDTDLSRHMDDDDYALLEKRTKERGGEWKKKTIPAGAATSTYAATAPELTGKGGAYLDDCAIAPVDDKSVGQASVRSYAIDPDGAEKLWALSEELLGQKFDLG